MAKCFSLAFTPVLLGWLTSCGAAGGAIATDGPPQQSVLEAQVSWMIRDLAHLRTGDEMRAHLRDGLEANDINYVGFDQVTVAQCIDRVVAAAMDDRSNPGSQEVRARLVESLEIYFDAKREAVIRRLAGAAPCQPFMR